MKKYGPRVVLAFRHFPSPMHPHAPAAAEAAEAAAKAEKFWEMYDQLYRQQKALSNRDIRRYAEAIGVDAPSAEQAIDKQAYRNRIQHDVRSGEESGIEGTPALFINGRAYDGDVTVDALSEVIDRALA